MDLEQDQQARASLGRAPVLNRRHVERALLAAGTTALFAAGYFGVGRRVPADRAVALASPLDARIPFLPGSVWIYLSLFPMAFLPLFVVRCPRLFRRTIAAYVAAIAVSIAVFALYPVTSAGLRADADSLDASRFAPWVVALLYRIDPPYNLFPSLHLSIAALAALTAWRASRRYGAAACCAVLPIAASICTVKQHFAVDGVAGLGLASLVYGGIVHGYERRPGSPTAYGWRGPAAFAAVVVILYASLYLAFAIKGDTPL